MRSKFHHVTPRDTYHKYLAILRKRPYSFHENEIGTWQPNFLNFFDQNVQIRKWHEKVLFICWVFGDQ